MGRQIAESQSHGVFVGSIDTPMHTKVLDTLQEAHYVMPGYVVFAKGTALYAQRFDARSWKVEGDALPIAQDAMIQPNVLRSGYAVSQTGALVYDSYRAVGDLNSW